MYMYYFTNTKSSRSHARDTDSFVVPGDFCIAFVLPLRATRITRPRIGQWSDPQAALVANHSLWGNHRKPLDTILELHDLASFPHWTGSRRMSLNNFKLLEDHCKSLSGPFLWKHILPTHTHSHTPSFHILSNMFLVGTAGKQSFDIWRISDTEVWRPTTWPKYHRCESAYALRGRLLRCGPGCRHMPSRWVGHMKCSCWICTALRLYYVLSMTLSVGCNHYWWVGPRSRQHVCLRYNQYKKG